MIRKFVYLSHIAKVFTPKKLINLIKIYSSYYYSLYSRNIIHKGNPWSLSIETGTFCNLSCLECPSGQKQFHRPTGYLSLENFKIIIDQQKDYLIWLIMYFQGEPYMNKDFFDMVSYAKKNNIFTSTSTNAHFLDKENAKKTINSGLDKIIISLDGTTQESYEKYRIGGDYQSVINGINNLVQTKKELRASNPYIIVQFIVFKTNEHQITEIKKLKKELKFDKLEIKTAQIYSSTDNNQLIPKNKAFSRYKQKDNGKWVVKHSLKNKCKRMWQSAVITWDGNVLPCCFDKDGDYVMGNILDESFEDIKRRTNYKEFRNKVFSNRKDIDICRNCTEK